MALARGHGIQALEDNYEAARRDYSTCNDPATKAMFLGSVNFCYTKWEDAKKADAEGV